MIVINGVFLYVVKILMLINILSVVKIDHCARENDDRAIKYEEGDFNNQECPCLVVGHFES